MPTQIDYEYDHSLYGVEHESGPFDVTREIVDVYTRSIGDDNPIFTDAAAARAAGYAEQVAPPTLCALFERGELPDIKLQFGRRQFHRRATGRAPRAHRRRRPPHRLVPPERRVHQDRPLRHHGPRGLGDYLQQPGRCGRSRRPALPGGPGVIAT